MELAEVIKSLDPTIDENWTEAGLPSLDRVRELAGRHYSRKEITEAFPLLTREKLLAGESTTVNVASETKPVEGEKPPEIAQEQEDAVVEEESELEVAERELSSVESELVTAQAALDEAAREVARLSAVRDKWLTRVDALQPPHSTTHDIMHYLQSQQRQREARAQSEDTRSQLDRELGGRRRSQRSPL